MHLRPRTLSALLVSAAIAVTAAAGLGATTLTAQASPDSGAVHMNMDHSAVAAVAGGDDPDGDGYIPAVPQVTGVTPSWNNPPDRYFHEFQANCSVTKTAPDDPIVYAGRPGASHDHTFMGNTATDANSTTASLSAGSTACTAVGDLSGYWMPTLLNGTQKVLPTGPQTIYYKTGVTDYTSVRPFPKGLRFVVGSPTQTAAEFRAHKGWVEGWECGESFKNTEFPANCPAGSQLNIRMQSPSCWDGKNLDVPDHKAHMAYPVTKPGNNDNVCPASHPVAVPMVEFKMAFPVSGDMSQVRLSSGSGHTFHYDFFNAWDERTLNAMVEHCIKGGLQCNNRGYDQFHPEAGTVLGPDGRLP
ncbi:DUF1996 domain-containing protein [Streptomyces sp. NPDC058401]|uniref:DUF1996 domain-containing protein n=1 Tax=Streptomyces sp. NPDC058401 TaxID=3346480 RepID=UPI0036638D07